MRLPTRTLVTVKGREGQTARASSILGPKTASFYSSGSARVSLLVEYSARNTRLFGRPSNTRLGILDFSAGLQILGSEYSTFRPTFEYSARNTRLFGRTSECNHSETVCPNHLKFAVQVVPTMDPCGLKFQVIRTNGSRVIAVGSWAEKIGNLQFPVRLTDSLLIYFIRSQLLYLTTDRKYYYILLLCTSCPAIQEGQPKPQTK